MSDKSIYSKTFNQKLFEFLDDIISIFPDNMDIVVSRNYFETIKKANPTLLLKIWYQYIYVKYQVEIDTGNISFFLDKDYSEDLSLLPNAKEVMKTIDTSLREPIRNMDPTNLDHCIKYIQILSKLSAGYMKA
jgi:hypothetical protein